MIYFSMKEGNMKMLEILYRNLGKSKEQIQKNLPIHERKILENIQLSNYNYSNNLLQIYMMIFKLRGKLEIIKILKNLNIITVDSYNFIQKEAKEKLNNFILFYNQNSKKS